MMMLQRLFRWAHLMSSYEGSSWKLPHTWQRSVRGKLKWFVFFVILSVSWVTLWFVFLHVFPFSVMVESWVHCYMFRFPGSHDRRRRGCRRRRADGAAGALWGGRTHAGMGFWIGGYWYNQQKDIPPKKHLNTYMWFFCFNKKWRWRILWPAFFETDTLHVSWLLWSWFLWLRSQMSTANTGGVAEWWVICQ